MFISQPKQSHTDKYVAGGLTLFILLATLMLMQWLALPEMKQKTEVYEEINWTRFKPKPPTISKPPESAPVPVEPETPVTVSEIPEVAPVRETVKKVDLSDLNVFKKQQLTQTTQTLDNRPKETKTGSVTDNSKINLQKSTLLAGMNTLLGNERTKMEMPRSGTAGRKRTSSVAAITAGSGEELAMGKKISIAGSQSLGAPQTKEVAAGNVDIEMINMNEINSDYADLSPIYYALIEWMKKNPAKLPGVVDRFMEKGSGDLTSKVIFQMDGREFELYLLAKEAIAEVRISLLEGNQSTYLIDRGFKENSRFLRVGSVNRTPTGNILSFGTVRKEASDQRATQFYQIFLSWWDSVK